MTFGEERRSRDRVDDEVEDGRVVVELDAVDQDDHAALLPQLLKGLLRLGAATAREGDEPLEGVADRAERDRDAPRVETALDLLEVGVVRLFSDLDTGGQSPSRLANAT